MGIKERKKRNAKKMRHRILVAAMELFARGGYDHVSMRRIAKKIEYSPAAIYRYFENKQDIMRQLCFQGFEQLLALQQRLDHISDPLIRLKEGCRGYIAFAMENQEMYTLMFATRQVIKQTDNSEESVALESFSKLTSHICDCIQKGYFHKGDPETLALSFWAALHGLSTLLINQQLRFLPKDKIGNMVEDVLSFFLRTSEDSHLPST